MTDESEREGKREEKETNLEDFDRTEERDHHGREEEGVGNIEIRQRRSELVKIWKEWRIIYPAETWGNTIQRMGVSKEIQRINYYNL